MKDYIIATVLACGWLIAELRFVLIIILFNIGAYLYRNHKKLNSSVDGMKSKKYLVVKKGA